MYLWLCPAAGLSRAAPCVCALRAVLCLLRHDGQHCSGAHHKGAPPLSPCAHACYCPRSLRYCLVFRCLRVLTHCTHTHCATTCHAGFWLFQAHTAHATSAARTLATTHAHAHTRAHAHARTRARPRTQAVDSYCGKGSQAGNWMFWIIFCVSVLVHCFCVVDDVVIFAGASGCPREWWRRRRWRLTLEHAFC
jgi:hypothetical protein